MCNLKVSRAAIVSLLALVATQPAFAQGSSRPCRNGPGVQADTVLTANERQPTSLLRAINPKAPLYPVELRNRGIQGEVRANFVVDTLGRVVDGSVMITRETERAFGDAVCVNLASARFVPYVTSGTKRSVELRDVRISFTLRR